MKNKIENNYNSLWGKYNAGPFQDLLNRGYAYHYDEDEKGSDILYVGINPSYTEGSEVKIMKETEFESFPFDRTARHPYFDPFRKIKGDLEKEPYSLNSLKWTHLDVLVFRETNQKYIDTLLQKENGIPFVYDQVMIARDRILHIQPKVIVVSNTKARQLMGKDRFIHVKTKVEHLVWMGFEYKFDIEYGTYRIINIPELAHTHVLFSSMLSGQRALDLGSRERMVWQIGRVLGKN